ncbi:hypothetical protein C1646_749860 [Rhizophagus diaphanus]|nr:hypothetical protein C1646_749860 [Rhizophagus diaphanus] [Rhizophagus sp. MUCL 43196]
MSQIKGQFMSQIKGQFMSQIKGQFMSQIKGQFMSQIKGQFMSQTKGQFMPQIKGQFMLTKRSRLCDKWQEFLRKSESAGMMDNEVHDSNNLILLERDTGHTKELYFSKDIRDATDDLCDILSEW